MLGLSNHLMNCACFFTGRSPVQRSNMSSSTLRTMTWKCSRERTLCNATQFLNQSTLSSPPGPRASTKYFFTKASINALLSGIRSPLSVSVAIGVRVQTIMCVMPGSRAYGQSFSKTL